jgi:tRNA(fMet)-specific endonuclease VapC
VFVLDTDHLSILQQESRPDIEILRAKLARQNRADVTTTIVTFQEQVEGWFLYLKKARDSDGILRAYARMSSVLEYFCKSKVLPFSAEAQNRFGDLRRHGVRVGTMDLRIASICLATDSVLLSRNLRDFSKVPGLFVEDWTH